MRVDWSERGEYMQRKHGVSAANADEALADPDRVVLDPDPSSRSGMTVRTIGYAAAARTLLTVITLEKAGTIYGVNGWPSNSTDHRRYRRGML